MKCDAMPELMVSLLYEELDAGQAKAVKAHLKTCEACRKIYEELKGTSRILEKWEEETPHMNLVFVREQRQWRERIREKLAGLRSGPRLGLILPVAAAAVLVLLSLVNFRVRVNDGGWEMSMSLLPKSGGDVSEAALTRSVEQARQETLLLVAQLIEESEYKQRRESALTLAQFAQDMEQQRQRDLRVLGQGLQGLQLTTEGQFQQTNRVLNDLIQMASYRLEQK